MAMIVKIVDALNVSKNAKVRLSVLNKLVNHNYSQVISDRLVIIVLFQLYGSLAKTRYETGCPWSLTVVCTIFLFACVEPTKNASFTAFISMLVNPSASTSVTLKDAIAFIHKKCLGNLINKSAR